MKTKEEMLRVFRLCGIEHIASEPLTGGFLGLTVRFQNYYWVVTGKVSREAALKAAADPAGLTIRVSGSCIRPRPEDQWEWYLGRKAVLSMENKAEMERFASSDSTSLREIALEGLSKYLFSDDPESIGAKPYITLYHVDSDIGLRVLLDAHVEFLP